MRDRWARAGRATVYLRDAERLGIKMRSVRDQAASLSGGNQQKVVLAKWLFAEPALLILDEPTRGIDVGAKFEIYSLIARLAEEGRGIDVISSELPEVLRVSHRIAVMAHGHITGFLDNEDASQENIMELATVGKAQLKGTAA